MSADDQNQEARVNSPETPTAGTTATTEARKRPRIDLGKDRKRGKTMFGLVLGTLNKAKIEDKERNASEAAKKRQLIDQRLQNKLRKETDSVRRAEEVKKDKNTAGRKEEELQLKDSIHKLRRRQLPLLSHFLITTDVIREEGDDIEGAGEKITNPLALPARGHPPPLYYLPAILLPSQEAFLNRRKAEVREKVEDEWTTFLQERTAGIEEISKLRERVAQEEERRKTEQNDGKEKGGEEEDTNMDDGGGEKVEDSAMQVDEEKKKEDTPVPPVNNDDADVDAVEY